MIEREKYWNTKKTLVAENWDAEFGRKRCIVNHNLDSDDIAPSKNPIVVYQLLFHGAIYLSTY